MKFIQHNSPQQFHQTVGGFLLQQELINNVIIGLVSRMIHQGETFGDVFLAHVENRAGDILAATMCIDGRVILSHVLDMTSVPPMVEAFTERYKSLTDVVGTAEASTVFAELWQQKSGQPFRIQMEMGLYQLDAVIPPQNVSGEVRAATASDFEMLVDWFINFGHDTGLGTNYSRDEACRNIRSKLEKPILGGIRIWMDEGKSVSMAAATRELPHGGNISLVYTPNEFRGRGYASAVTAHVSQEILDLGKSFCCLSTDMANPTSNKIYQTIGYKFVGNHRRLEFENRE